MQHFIASVGVGSHPPFDGLHGCIVQFEFSFVDQVTPNRSVRITVLFGIAHTHRFSVGQHHSPRALNLQEEGLHGIIHPQKLVPGEQALFLNFFTCRLRHNAIAL